jgi:hypothetical protein
MHDTINGRVHDHDATYIHALKDLSEGLAVFQVSVKDSIQSKKADYNQRNPCNAKSLL